MVDVRALSIPEVLELRPPRFGDDRGFFSEVWRHEWASELGQDLEFVQDNHSWSRQRGVLRGMHFQIAPEAQHKLVRVARGSVFDVALDLRSSSPTFGQWTAAVLSADEWNQLFIPIGFAHGFVTLEDDSEVLYKVTARYSPEHDRAIRFDDPDLAIAWPVEADSLIVSEKDRNAPLLRDLGAVF